MLPHKLSVFLETKQIVIISINIKTRPIQQRNVKCELFKTFKLSQNSREIIFLLATSVFAVLKLMSDEVKNRMSLVWKTLPNFCFP